MSKKALIPSYVTRNTLATTARRIVQAAMQQIYLKNYRQRFALSGKPITKVGINFDSMQGNITDWVIE